MGNGAEKHLQLWVQLHLHKPQMQHTQVPDKPPHQDVRICDFLLLAHAASMLAHNCNQ